MATNNTTSLDAAQISDIARQIRGAVLPILAADADTKEAKDAAQNASQAGVSLRESIMVSLAALSQKGQWSEREVSTAAAKAAAGQNDKATAQTITTFVGECKRAMKPMVRAHVPMLIDLRDAAWDAETEAWNLDKTNAPTPLRKAFKRKYHMLIQLFDQAEQGNVFEDTASVIAFAETRDPALDYKAVKKRLDTIRKTLAQFYHDFPVDDIQLCVDTLNEVTDKALKASRDEGTVPVKATPVVTPPITTRAERKEIEELYDQAMSEPAVEPEEPEEGEEVEEDILGDVLGEVVS